MRRFFLAATALAIVTNASCGALLTASDEPSSPPNADASTTNEADAATAEGGSGGAVDGGDGAVVGPHLRVFLTSRQFTLSEIRETPDTLCTSQLPPSLAGAKFVPWLSTSARAARDAIKGEGPWRLVTGEMVAANRAALFGGTLASAINVDENGVRLGFATNVWTGTKPSGELADNCNDWQTPNQNVLVGSVVRVDERWTALSNAPTCENTLSAVYCFESE